MIKNKNNARIAMHFVFIVNVDVGIAMSLASP